MSLLRNLASGMRSLFRKEQVDREFDEELRVYQEMAAEEKMKQGMSRKDALRAVRLERGSLEVTKEVVRSAGWESVLQSCWQDLRHAARWLVRAPVFTGVAIFSLALGIGAPTITFSLFDAILLNAVSARNHDRLKHIEIGGPVSYRLYRELARDTSSIEGLGAYTQTSLSVGTAGAELEKLTGDIVSGNFFNVLGVSPGLGRGFTPEEGLPENQPRVAILSYSFWERRFQSNPTVLDATIEVNGERYSIVGVLAKDYRSIHGYGITPEVYIPFRTGSDAGEPQLELFARLKEGMTIAQARAEMDAALPQWRQRFPADDLTPSQVQLSSLTGIEKMRRDGVPVPVTLFFALLLLVAGLVLLIGCANVAGLLLARGISRSREIAIRLAVGASRSRLLQMLLTESLLLALLGAGVGIGICAWAATLMDQLQFHTSVPLELHLKVDLRTLVFAALLGGAATVLSGLMPALQASKSRWQLGANQIGDETKQRVSFRRGMVIGQFSLAFTLLAVAGLFVRSLEKIAHVDPGFDVKHLVTAEVDLNPGKYSKTRSEEYFRTAIAEISRIPGVRSVSGSAVLPLGIEHSVYSMKVGNRGVPFVHVNSITPGHFRTMGISFFRGRDFTEYDREGAPPVAIINETFAKMYFANHAIGGSVLFPRPGTGTPPLFSKVQVVGVVADSKYGSLGEEPTPALYWPVLQEYRPLILAVNTTMDTASTLRAVQDLLVGLDPQVPVKLQSMDEQLSGALLPSRIASALLGTIGLLGLLLAAIGIYGVMTYSVNRRTAEIGVRLALGARRDQVMKMVMRDAFGLALMGIAAGLVMALLITRPLAVLVAAGMNVIDPFSLGAVTVLLGATALISAALPAWRASRVDPMIALRYE